MDLCPPDTRGGPDTWSGLRVRVFEKAQIDSAVLMVCGKASHRVQLLSFRKLKTVLPPSVEHLLSAKLPVKEHDLRLP